MLKFSDTSYESCTTAPDSNSNLRLTKSCVVMPHMLFVLSVNIPLFVCFFQMIKKDLKKYSKIFEQKDRLSQSKASKV